ncbi:MAG: Gfo/Idh/MocA family oxidoreductase [Bacteroidales bacterium]|nr:Gfo/Idh/MocA family oxidoreductase [Bacteroidales bacterium]MDY0217214.1 Gfo/Idh/MocA family oxidoreductase [Bacteroidales bacterium]
MIKIGILGAGHLGKIHIKCILESEYFDLIGFFDPDKSICEAVSTEFGIKNFNSSDELMDAVDIVDIVTPTVAHFELAVKAIKKSKHVFIEKPIVATPEEAKKLVNLATEASVKVQVGHVERFNPAFLAARPHIHQPKFIETHRLAMFNPRGTDVPVVLDLMIHDIDIVLSVVRSDIKRISANGVSVVSDTPDIANARIEFDNGCVANLTASRLSMKNMRKSRFFQNDAYISVDYLEKKTEIIRMQEVQAEDNNPFAMVIDLGEKGQKQIYFENPEIKNINAIKMELETFASSIINNTTPMVTIEDGCNALEVAYQIMAKINK